MSWKLKLQPEGTFILNLVPCDPAPAIQPSIQEAADATPPNQSPSLLEPAHPAPSLLPPSSLQGPPHQATYMQEPAMLSSQKGRTKFMQYMKSKPAKYGIKIFWVCDAKNPYAIDGIVYTGRKPGEGVNKNLGLNIVQHLLEKGLTIVGTLRQNKPDIPPVMKASKTRKLFSTEFGFNGSMTMTKGSVDIVDQMVGTYTCKRYRWPMLLWYNMINIATLNAYSFFKAQHPEFDAGITNARWRFLTELSNELVTPYMRSRMEGNPCLPAYITETMGRCGTTKAIQSQERSRQGQQKRKRSKMCPRNKDRKASNSCWKCSDPVCSAHSQKQVVCNSCSQ
ncbi:piggyBac transposable element-derived protein 4-like [Scomber scombrus]|uniref:PiggyBac transposable element-derived protein 4-like n=1 Tax=Scomber scombrus TaxID=13677 RepID=A0AAV1PHY1_SCOSC